MKILFSILLILISTFIIAQDRSTWFEFYLPWDDSTKTITDMSGYLDAPAGKHGFLQITPDGHFRFENKEDKERFVGVVNVAISNFPTKEQARIIAARMAKFGINLVRIHLIDVEGQYGLFLNSGNNTTSLHPDRLDRMDYFIKCLKDKGIYFNFCIHAGRIYKYNDGIDAPISNNQSKYSTLFNQKLIDLQKDFALKTIGHLNPYTGLTYAEDPAMAQVELTNENSLFNGWMGWNSDFIFKEKVDGIGSFYSNELDEKFNNWLSEKYANDSELEQFWAGNDAGITEELVKNGSFEQNFTSWGNYVRTQDATGNITIDESEKKDGAKSAKIGVTSPGSQHWHVHLKTNNFKAKNGKAYKISFYAKADSNRLMQLEIMENQTWKWIGAPQINLTKNWQLFETYFNSTFDSDAMIVQFEWGKSAGTFWLDSVSITQTSGEGLEAGESLAQKNIKRTKNTEIGKHTAQRVGDNAAFYFHIEKKYTDQLSTYLKNDLGVRCPVTFTNNYYGLTSIYSQSQADYMDFHMYWDHPNFPNGWSDINFSLKNKSMMLDPKASTINRMLLSKVKNKPFVLSEYNHAYPYIFQSEAPSLLYAYGSFFDLDGIVWHAYYDYMNRFTQRHQDMFFDVAMHPVMMTQMLLALPYRMHFLKKAETIVEANYKTSDVFYNTKIFQDEDVLNFENVETGTYFLNHGFQHANFEADSTYLSHELTNPGKVVETETGEIFWDGNQGYFTVKNPYWQGATGYLGNKNITLENIHLSNITTTNNLNFASIHLISLDSLPISKSKKMILLTSARLENEGLQWNTEKTSLVAKGGNRALCEPVEALVQFKNASADSLMIFPLDERGNRVDSLLINQFGSDVRFLLNNKTLWYEISNHRASSIPQSYRETEYNRSLIKIYPNPGRYFATVDYSFSKNEKLKFVLYNSTGQKVQQKLIPSENNKNQTLKIDLSELESGLYFCGFENPGGEKIMEKLVVTE